MSSDDDDDDMPLAAVAAKTGKKKIKIKIGTSPKRNITPPSPVPSSNNNTKAPGNNGQKKRKRENGSVEPEKVVSSSSSSSPKKKKKKKTAPNSGKGLKKLEKAERLQYAMQSFLWWNAKEPPEGCQWLTMEHAGVSFPDPYEPHGVKMKYNGKPIDLNPVQEEA